jgi:hypothetical protein
MPGDELTAEDLKRAERAEREERERARTDAEADTHERRADKAAYLREKLAEQEQADRETEPVADDPPGAPPPPDDDGAAGR